MMDLTMQSSIAIKKKEREIFMNTTENELIVSTETLATDVEVSDETAASLSAIEQAALEMGVIMDKHSRTPLEVSGEVPSGSDPAKAPRKGRQPGIAHERFMAVWEASANLEEVCATLGINKTVASARATQLRAKGATLKSFPRGRRKGQTLAPGQTKAALRAEVASLRSLLDQATA
jgi:hypothetical protein